MSQSTCTQIRTPRWIISKLRQLLYQHLLIWYMILRYGAAKWLRRLAEAQPLDLPGRRRFLRRNLLLQERLLSVFAPYGHLCQECPSVCCHLRSVPHYEEVDSLTYLLFPDRMVKAPPWKFKHLLVGIAQLSLPGFLLQLIQRLAGGRRTSSSANSGSRAGYSTPPCLALGQEGCLIPGGARPVLCLIYLCGRLLIEMSWRDYWRYFWLSCRYLTGLTVFLRAFSAEMQENLPG